MMKACRKFVLHAFFMLKYKDNIFYLGGKMGYKILLFDLDDTLLDFGANEAAKSAYRRGFRIVPELVCIP